MRTHGRLFLMVSLRMNVDQLGEKIHRRVNVFKKILAFFRWKRNAGAGVCVFREVDQARLSLVGWKG